MNEPGACQYHPSSITSCIVHHLMLLWTKSITCSFVTHFFPNTCFLSVCIDLVLCRWQQNIVVSAFLCTIHVLLFMQVSIHFIINCLISHSLSSYDKSSMFTHFKCPVNYFFFSDFISSAMCSKFPLSIISLVLIWPITSLLCRIYCVIPLVVLCPVNFFFQ